jgi:hypothetical protein
VIAAEIFEKIVSAEWIVCEKCASSEKQLKLRPYRFQVVHQPQQRDTAARIQYCHWFRRFVREGVHVFDNSFPTKRGST